MYNYNLLPNEEVKKIFDSITIQHQKDIKETSIIITSQRILFLDYLINPNSPEEVLRIAKGVQYPKYKEVYYQINLKDITKIENHSKYRLILKDNFYFEFEDKELYTVITKLIK